MNEPVNGLCDANEWTKADFLESFCLCEKKEIGVKEGGLHYILTIADAYETLFGANRGPFPRQSWAYAQTIKGDSSG